MNGPQGGIAVSIRTLGCKVNRVESEGLAAALLEDGCVLVEPDEADVVVVNTCTVTGEADSKARKAVRQALRAAGGPVVVVTGCLASVDASSLSALGERVVVEPDKSRVAQRIRTTVPPGRTFATDAAARDTAQRTAFRTRSMIKIEDGCDNFCAYCIVPYARGVPRAVALDEILRQATSMVESGTREIVLTGINIGRYDDATSGAHLAQVVAAVARTGISRVRISSIEPPDLSDEVLDVLAATDAVCSHLHVPLQSGSDLVLAAMGRSYDSGVYRERIESARRRLPGLAVTTDLIAGLPGETEADHACTIEFVERIGFSKLHVFPYSARAGTPAASMVQVEPTVRSRRAAELRAVGEGLRARHAESLMGHSVEVLVERTDGATAVGTTREYLRLQVPAPGVAVGDEISVILSPEMIAF
ncbi:MAG: tRNA (N(6)-L-threonylcarbamoyladenosine(37)-C(2))-methylthiotransferase MtaB [Coriobacteriia bacterium]|nr:tRNA (N(6)-L-threonylcarbamoyladenosine(37)-C(2))-methylthiotransferase MtaB [Coriobacteriia bacterium]